MINKKSKNLGDEKQTKSEDKNGEKENVNQNIDTSEETSTTAISETEKLKEQVKDLNDKLLRTLAELENTRRRSREEMEKTSKYAISKFATDLIPVAENFYLAIGSAPKDEIEKSEKLKNFHKGIEMTQTEMTKVFEKNNIKRVYPLHEEFNHDLHEAISNIPSDEKEGTILDVLQAGYSINDRLLRPALVVVATAKKE